MADFIVSFSQTIQHLGVFGYWIVFLAAFLESLVFIGALLPGGTIIIIAGFLSAQGYLDIGDLIWFAAAGSILGDGISYWLGTKGTRFFHNENRILKLSHIEKGREFFKKHGNKSVFLGRHLGPLRAIVPFLAGLSKMDTWTFLFWNTISAFSFAISSLFAGYLSGKTIKATVGIWSTRIELFLFLFLFFSLFVWFLVKKSRYFFIFIRSIGRSIKWAIISNPDVKRLLRRYPRFFAFLGQRLRKDKFFGLPLTLLFIAFLFTLFLFLGVVQDIVTSDQIVALDVRVSSLLLMFRNAKLVTIFLWITLLGKLQIVLSLAVVVSFLCYIWRKNFYILPLWIAIAGSEFFGFLGKITIHRQRPDVAVYTERLSSFPSGHAVIAVVLYGFIAYILFRAVKKWRYKINIVFVNILLVLAVGFSRLYLGAHFLSDVWGGYLLGFLWLIIGITLSEWIISKKKRSILIPVKRVRIISSLLIAGELLFYIGFALQYRPIFTIIQEPQDTIIGSTVEDISLHTLPAYTEALTGENQEPLSFILAADNDEAFITIMGQAGWYLADEVTLFSFTHLIKAAFLNESYSMAPITPSFWNANAHTFGFEKPTQKNSVRERHHARFWRTQFKTREGKRLYVGTASFDSGIKWFSFSHIVDPNIDGEREFLFSDLQSTGEVRYSQKRQFVPPSIGKNFGGDEFFTDGKVYIFSF